MYLQDERLTYATEPQSFLQEFLRREPAVGELPLLLRTAHADAGRGYCNNEPASVPVPACVPACVWGCFFFVCFTGLQSQAF